MKFVFFTSSVVVSVIITVLPYYHTCQGIFTVTKSDLNVVCMLHVGELGINPEPVKTRCR